MVQMNLTWTPFVIKTLTGGFVEVTGHFMGKVFKHLLHLQQLFPMTIAITRHYWVFNQIFKSSRSTGSYFARDASYSDRYARSRNGKTKKMFMALVLVGDFIRGNNSLVRPPQKPHSQRFYDSCVDNEANPAIFVVFEKFQIYPEYIIEYSWVVLSNCVWIYLTHSNILSRSTYFSKSFWNS